MLNPEIIKYVSAKAKIKLEKKYKEIIEKKEKVEKKGEAFSPTEEEKQVISRYEDYDSNVENECRAWIIEVSDVAEQRHFSTHIPKFIHPDISQFSNILIFPDRENDGYIRTGNVPAFLDSFGNAAAMPATELMLLEIDGKPLFEHILKNTTVGNDFVDFFGDDASHVRTNFMKMLTPGDISSTDARARQVFFPTGDKDEYHIITPLMSSPVMNKFITVLDENKKYNNNPTDSDSKNPPRAKELENDGKYLEEGYWTLTDTVNINYGGTKPQNISSFNNKAKSIKLMKSLPPEIRRRKIRIPTVSFFAESVYPKANRYSDLFTELENIFKDEKRNIDVRKKRDRCLFDILQQIASDIAAVRYEISFNEGNYKGSLDPEEYIMLYENDRRYEDDEWLETISEKFSRWFFNTCKTFSGKILSFGDAEYRYVRDYALKNKEVFIQ